MPECYFCEDEATTTLMVGYCEECATLESVCEQCFDEYVSDA
jgi:hypothetical protein